MCAHGARGGFLRLLSSDRVRKTALDHDARALDHGIMARAPPTSAFRWIGARGIKLDTLVIDEDVEEEDWAYLRRLALDASCIDRLQSLQVWVEPGTAVVDVTMLLLQCYETLQQLVFRNGKTLTLPLSEIGEVVSYESLVPYIARSVLL